MALCDWCGESVDKPDWYLDKVENTFCGKECRSSWQSAERSGENHPSYKGGKKTVACEFCDDSITRYPSNLSDRNFCNAGCQAEWYKENLSGEDHPNYEHGARDDRFTDSEREEIFERDNYTCQECGDDSGGNLNAHHIIPSSEDRDMAHDIDNGVTLCIDCHAERHDEPVSSFILAQKS